MGFVHKTLGEKRKDTRLGSLTVFFEWHSATVQLVWNDVTAIESIPNAKPSVHNSRHHPDLSEQPALAHTLKIRLAQRSWSQQSSAHLVRRSLVTRNSDRSFSEQHAGKVVHATIVPHATHHALRITGIGGIGVGNGAPLDIFFAGLSVVGSVLGTLRDFIVVGVLTLCLDRHLAV